MSCSTMRPFQRVAFLLLLVGCLSLPMPSTQAAEPDGDAATATAGEMIGYCGAPGGMCAVAGTGDARLALALAKQGSFTVQCLFADQEKCREARRAIDAEGLYGTVSANTFDPRRGKPATRPSQTCAHHANKSSTKTPRPGKPATQPSQTSVHHANKSDTKTLKRFPYTNNLLNLVVIGSLESLAGGGLSVEEVLRVLAPLGTAYVGTASPTASDKGMAESLQARLKAAGVEDLSVVEGNGLWVRFRKAWPESIDEWSHFLHGADGNPVARDRVVGPPQHYQWTAGPMWLRSHETDSSVCTMVTAAGRLFFILDDAPISLAGQNDLPDKWFLVARDAFNGVDLWRVPIRRWGWHEWKHSWFNTRPGDVPLNIQKRLVATRDSVYATLGYHVPVSQLDARTGELLQTYEDTGPANEVLHLDGTLILSRLTGPVDDNGLTAYTGGQVMAVDAASGRTLWVSEKSYRGTTVDYIRWKEMHGTSKPAKLDPSLNLATDGDTVALIDGPDLVGLDFRTGAELWRSSFPLAEADLNAGGIDTQGNLWSGTMIVSNGVVLHASPSKLGALSAKTGEVLWTQPKKYIGHLWYAWKDIFLIDGLVWTWTADLVREPLERDPTGSQKSVYPRWVLGYDLKTGRVEREVDLGFIFKSYHHHRCYRNKATERFILASRRGTEFVDLEEGVHSVHNWVRGACHFGMMPANGLQYAPPHPCQCYIEEKLNGMNALAPAESKEPIVAMPPAERLERGDAVSAGREAGAEDWPTFRYDNRRSGATVTRVPDTLVPVWRGQAGRKVSAPTVVSDSVFVSLVDEHQVACLDAASGEARWKFTAGARVDSPPTHHRGTVLFGSADGWVYCVRADDGRLVWRFQAAPTERFIGSFGQLESAWPVHGSVLVEDGIVYFAAGRTSQLDGGIHVYGLEAATGRVLHQVRLRGPDYQVDSEGRLAVQPKPQGDLEATFPENFRLPLGSLPDILTADGGKIFMQSRAFDAELKPVAGQAAFKNPGGFLDDSYFKRIPWRYEAGDTYSRLLVCNESLVCGVRMFDSLQGLDPTVYFSPGRQGYLLFCYDIGQKKRKWEERVPVRIRAMVLTPDRLCVAGPPDVVDPKDPLAAFEARKGGVLSLFDLEADEKTAEYQLPSPPVFNGAAAANGRLYLADEAGHVTCFAKP